MFHFNVHCITSAGPPNWMRIALCNRHCAVLGANSSDEAKDDGTSSEMLWNVLLPKQWRGGSKAINVTFTSLSAYINRVSRGRRFRERRGQLNLRGPDVGR